MLTESQKQILNNAIEKLIRESMFENDFFGGMDERRRSSTLGKKHYERDREEGRHNSSKEANARMAYIMNFLNKEQELHSVFAYELWPDKDEDTARSLFSKKYNGHSQGKDYKFDPTEINKLYNMINSYLHSVEEGS